MLIDTRIIDYNGPFSVLGEQTLVMWPDGSRIGLHLVLRGTERHPYLRATLHDALWVVFDLRQAGPATLDADLRTLHENDHAGAVLYTLRGQFDGADSALRTITGCAVRTWLADGMAAAQHMSTRELQLRDQPPHLLRRRTDPPAGRPPVATDDNREAA